MKKIETILEDLRTWVEEDSENRAIAVVTVQKKDETEDGYQSEQNHATVGVKQLLVDAFDTVMSDRDSDGLYGIWEMSSTARLLRVSASWLTAF